MPALSGTLAQNHSLYVSGTVTQAVGVVANAAETVAWVADKSAAGRIYRVTGLNATIASAELATGLTVPIGVALSSDESTLYVVEQTGIVKAGNPTTGSFSQVGTMAGFGGNWEYAKDGRDGYIYMQSSSLRGIYRYSMANNTGELLVPNPGHLEGSYSNGFAIMPDAIYTFVSMAGLGTSSVLSKCIPIQGRFEVVAGKGTAANTDGEAFLVSAFDVSGDVEIDSTGAYLYGGTEVYANARLRLITGGNVSSLNVGSNWGAGNVANRMWMLRTANKILMSNGTSLGLIT